MSDPSTSANGLMLDITSDDPGIAYSREAYAEVCRLRAENSEKETMLLNQAKTIKKMQAENEALREALKPLRELVQLADSIREAQRGYMADRGNGAKGAAVGAAAAAYDEARAAYEGEK